MRQEEYIHAGKPLRRMELPDQPVKVFTWERVTRNQNKDYPTKVVHWVGLHSIRIGEQEILSDRSTISDSGPVGVSVAYTKPPETEPTQEEREYNRRMIQKVAAQAMVEQGIW